MWPAFHFHHSPFLPKFQPSNHSHTIDWCHWERKTSLYLLFVEYKKAFDLREQNAAIKPLLHQGVFHEFIEIIWASFKEATTELSLFNDLLSKTRETYACQKRSFPPGSVPCTEYKPKKARASGSSCLWLDGNYAECQNDPQPLEKAPKPPKRDKSNSNHPHREDRGDKRMIVAQIVVTYSPFTLMNCLSIELDPYRYLGKVLQMSWP